VSNEPKGVNVLVRVWLPDRPGALGLVASRIGSVGGDIVGIDVLERGTEVAVDEFAVRLEEAAIVELMVREIEQVDGASVEQVRVVTAFPDPRIDALESAAVLCEAASVADLHEVLLGHSRDEFLADWSALICNGEVVAAAGDTHPPAGLLAALAAGTSASPRVADGTTGPEDLAVARLDRHGATLLALARIADRAWMLLGA
jgi:ACT domain-containing protein